MTIHLWALLVNNYSTYAPKFYSEKAGKMAVYTVQILSFENEG